VAVCAYLKNGCIEKMGMFTGMLIMATAPVCNDLVHILLVEIVPVVAGVAEFRRFVDEEHIELRLVRIVAGRTVA
jgi:hypothetical protein